MEDMLSRACPCPWAPDEKERARYEKDLKEYEKELKSFRKFAEKWNPRGGGTLKELLAIIREGP